jgi:hypothetical protein
MTATKNLRSSKYALSGVIVAVACSALVSCHRFESVNLSLDFSAVHTWRYMFGIDVTGSIQSPDSSKKFSSSLRTYLSGEWSPHDVGAVRFRTGQAMITSNYFDDEERLHLERQFENQEFFFSPKEGLVNAVDTALPSLVNIGGWDLFRSFSRVLPVLPESPQRLGASWDRERTFPVETSLGNGTGWLYQLFTLDSIVQADSSRYAFISWRFSYRIQPDSAKLLAAFPLEGSGSGTTQIDITRKRMIKAHAFFDVPAKTNSGVLISWQESVHLELAN